MGRLHFIGGEKGGVGKSVVAKLLAQYCIDAGTPWAGFDTDRSHGGFRRAYAEFVQPIEVTRFADLDLTVEALEDGARDVVVDLAGQSLASLWHWLCSGRVPELLGDLGHEAWLWHVMDPSRDSVLLLESALDRCGNAGRLVCVLNHGRGSDFRLFHESKLRRRVEAAEGAVLELPELHWDSMRKIDADDKSFWAAVHNADPNEGPCLSLMERQRAWVFVRQAHASFAGLLQD